MREKLWLWDMHCMLHLRQTCKKVNWSYYEVRQDVELCWRSVLLTALLTVDLKLTKRAGRLSTVDQVRRSVKLCSRSATALTVPHLSSRGGRGRAFRKHNSLNRPTVMGKHYFGQNLVISEKFRNSKVYCNSRSWSSYWWVGREDKPKKQKSLSWGEKQASTNSIPPHITIWVGKISLT